MQQLPMFLPESDWKPPTELPVLRGQTVAVDSETCDQGLAVNKGPGWPYHAGYVCGVSAAWSGGSIYVPVRHPDTECRDPEQVRNWVTDLFRHNHVVFQSAPYDLGWFGTEWGISPPERLDDTILMAQTVDENRLSYGLDAICKWLSIPGKDESKLREAANIYNVDAKKGLYMLPARFVGPYAEQDATSTLGAYYELKKRLTEQELDSAYELDRSILPMVIEMRRRGIRVDMDLSERLACQAEAHRDEILAELSRRLPVGRRLTIDDVQSPKILMRLFAMEQVPHPMTPKTKQGSFQDDWLSEHSHWLPQMVAKSRKYQMFSHKFLRTFIQEYAHRGRIHSEIHSYRSDEGGTRSYRFSYSDPPLQQIPSRSKEGKIIRQVFLPEEGNLWLSADYSQQEYRLIVHYAYLLKQHRADEAVDKYRSDPKTDFHNLVVEWTGLKRGPAKDTNFAKAFGAGIRKFASMIGKSEEEAKEIYNQYDRELPFVSGAAREVQSVAQRRGFIRLIDGARSRFDLWERSWLEEGEQWAPPLPLDRARELYPGRRLKRADTRKAFNRLIQGSAARQTKTAMRTCWNEGLLPLLQMHDELCFSVSSDRMVARVKEIMVDAIKLSVPVMVEAKVGRSWGRARSRTPGAVDRWALAAARAIVASATTDEPGTDTGPGESLSAIAGRGAASPVETGSTVERIG